MIIKRPTIVVNADTGAGTFWSVATFVPIRRWGDVMRAGKLSSQVEKQLKQTPGIAAYSLAVDPLKRHFWTYSVWSDRDAVAPFTQAEPHATAVERFREWAGEGAAFVQWQSADAKLNWSEAFERLKQPSHYYQPPA